MTRRATEPELAWRTPAGWAEAALAEPLALLSDHAHCELGAAATAQSLLLRRTEDAAFASRLGALAAEELAHFRAVLRLLHEHGGALRPPVQNAYVEGLLARARASKSASALLDRLCVAALIERRSCERFELLARAAARADDPLRARLAALYADLVASERGHAVVFLDLARRVAPAADVERRLAELVALEAQAAQAAPPAARIHGGAGVAAEAAAR